MLDVNSVQHPNLLLSAHKVMSRSRHKKQSQTFVFCENFENVIHHYSYPCSAKPLEHGVHYLRTVLHERSYFPWMVSSSNNNHKHIIYFLTLLIDCCTISTNFLLGEATKAKKGEYPPNFRCKTDLDNSKCI